MMGEPTDDEYYAARAAETPDRGGRINPEADPAAARADGNFYRAAVLMRLDRQQETLDQLLEATKKQTGALVLVAKALQQKASDAPVDAPAEAAEAEEPTPTS